MQALHPLFDPSPRRWLFVLLLAGVLLVHFGLALHLPEMALGEGASKAPAVRRIDVAFVKELAPSQPTGAPAAPAPAATVPARSLVPAPAASAPMVLPPAEPQPVPEPEPASPVALAPAFPVETPLPAPATPPLADPTTPPLTDQVSPAASAPLASTPIPVAAAASAPLAARFEWPPSTRLSYSLNGNYRGDVQGSARVEWLRSGNRYQVHLDVAVGPSFAPLMSRRMSSEGELGPQGLHPKLYEEETRQLLREPRRRTIRFEPNVVVLPGGKQREHWRGMQDSASQFVQLSYLFSLRPELLKPGQTFEVPLALPSNTDRWVYEVLGREVLDTPLGSIETFHVKPRRETRPGGDLVAEMWFAPSLQYLPIRILIRQDADTFVDLLLLKAPQQGQP